MRKSWQSLAMVLLLGLWPQFGCLQTPADKSVQNLSPILPRADVAKKQEAPAADLAKSLLQQADLLAKAGKTKEAVAAYEKVRSTNGPDAWQATRKLALLCYRTGDLDRADQEFHLLQQQNPRDAQTLTYLGNIAYQRGLWFIAQKSFQDAIFYQGDLPDAWSGLGMTLAQQGAYNEGINAFAKVVSKAEAYCCVARVMNLQGKRQDAYRAYQTALSIDPNLQQAKIEMARLQVTLLTDPPSNVIATTALKTEKRGTVELEDAQASVVEGASRLLLQRPTLPPLDFDNGGDWTTGGKKK